MISIKQEKSSNKQSKSNLKQLEREQQTNPKVSGRKEISATINEIESNKMIQKTNESKRCFFF